LDAIYALRLAVTLQNRKGRAMNANRKGKDGEREFAAVLRAAGFAARRGQQFSGSPDSPDVVSAALPWLHVEVKRVQNLNLAAACSQAQGDAGGKPFIVAHRRNNSPWRITMDVDLFFRLLRGERRERKSP
jgi:Holliday junction resolvase